MNKEIMDKLVEFFVRRMDVRIIKTDGTEIIIDGYSLGICADPIMGRTKDKKDVSISRDDISDAVAA